VEAVHIGGKDVWQIVQELRVTARQNNRYEIVKVTVTKI